MLAAITNSNGINIALLLLRVTIGVTILLHGYNHIWGGGKIEGTARLVREPRHETGPVSRVAREHRPSSCVASCSSSAS